MALLEPGGQVQAALRLRLSACAFDAALPRRAGARASYARTCDPVRRRARSPLRAKFALKAAQAAEFGAANIDSMLTEADPGGGRVLVVEDDVDIADVLRRSLRNEGYEVRTSADGIEALDVAAGFVPDLVVLDLGLPGLDGVEVCRRLRSDGDVPILMLTARAETEDRVDRPRQRRRRLPGQAVRAQGAAGPDPGAAAPPAAARRRLAGGRRPRPQPRHPRGAAAASARSS